MYITSSYCIAHCKNSLVSSLWTWRNGFKNSIYFSFPPKLTLLHRAVNTLPQIIKLFLSLIEILFFVNPKFSGEVIANSKLLLLLLLLMLLMLLFYYVYYYFNKLVIINIIQL